MPGLGHLPSSRVPGWAVAEAERLQRKKRRQGMHMANLERPADQVGPAVMEIAVLVDEPCPDRVGFAVHAHPAFAHCWVGRAQPTLLDATEQTVAGHHARRSVTVSAPRRPQLDAYQSRKSDAPVKRRTRRAA